MTKNVLREIIEAEQKSPWPQNDARLLVFLDDKDSAQHATSGKEKEKEIGKKTNSQSFAKKEKSRKDYVMKREKCEREAISDIETKIEVHIYSLATCVHKNGSAKTSLMSL